MMVEKITKLKNLNWKLRFLICIVFTIPCVICTKMLLDDMENKVENYDYSQIEEIDGIVTNAYIEESYSDGTATHSTAYLEIELENGENVKINTGTKLNHEEGDSVIVYTDGKHYGIRKESVAMDATNSFINFFVAGIVGVFMCSCWIVLMGWKSILIAFLIMVIWAVVQEFILMI